MQISEKDSIPIICPWCKKKGTLEKVRNKNVHFTTSNDLVTLTIRATICNNPACSFVGNVFND